MSDSKVNLESKHITFVIDSMHGGGAENVCLTLVRELLIKQYRVDLVLLEFHGERLLEIPHDVNLFVLDRRLETRQSMENCSIPYKNIRRIKRPSGFKDCVNSTARYLTSLRYSFSFCAHPKLRHLFWTASLGEYMRVEQPTLILPLLFHSITVCLLARRFSCCNVPLICSFRNTLGYGRRRKEQMKIMYLKHLLPDAEKIHAISQGVANSIVNHIPEVQNKVATILNPIPHNVASLSKQSITNGYLPSREMNPIPFQKSS